MGPRKQVSLHDAVRAGDVKTLERFLRRGADPDERDAGGSTLMHTAARSYAVEAVKDLIRCGAAINAKDQLGNTPLWTATFESRGRGDVIELLLAAGADPNSVNVVGRTPFQLASAIHNYDVKQFFPSFATFGFTRSPLHEAAGENSAERVRALIAEGENPNSFDSEGNAPLHLAAHVGALETAEALITGGAVVDIRDGLDRTPLMLATGGEVNAVEMVMLLRSAGADPFARDKSGATPYDLANLYDDELSRVFTDIANPASEVPLIPNEISIVAHSISERTDRASIMYRDDDGRWVFLDTHQEPEYLEDPSNFVVTSLRSVVEGDPAVLEHIHEPNGTYLIRAGDQFVSDNRP